MSEEDTFVAIPRSLWLEILAKLQDVHETRKNKNLKKWRTD